MVKRTITITTILFILTMAVGLIVVLNRSSFAADDDIASGTSGTCSWVIDSEGTLTISPTDGISGTLVPYGERYQWFSNRMSITKVIVNSGVVANENSSYLFSYLNNCKEMDLTNLDTSNCTKMEYMFQHCLNLETLDLSNFNTSNVISMRYMFYNCEKIKSIDISSFNTNQVNNMNSLLSSCKELTSIDVSGFNTENVKDMGNMFNDCLKLEYVDVSNFNTSKVTNMRNMFSNCRKLSEIDISNFDTRLVTDTSCMFLNCVNVQNLDVSRWNTSNVRNMANMFDNCSRLQSLNVSNFDTSQVVKMGGMFEYCTKLTTIDVSNFNTSMVTDMSRMFQYCNKLSEIDVSGFDTSKVTNTEFMFSVCENLNEIDISTWDTSNVIDMECMFQACRNLTFIDLSSFDTSKVTNMGNFLYQSNNLGIVNLGENFSFEGIGNITYKAILPTPTAEGFTGKWIREDEAIGPYTPEELRDNYDGSTMAGTWIREISQLTVTYKYDGYIPQGVSELPETRVYTIGNQVTVAPNATAPGYTFSGWSRTGTFEMPAENVEITGSFTANTETPYKVEHYLEDLTEGEYTLAKTDNLTGTTDTEAQANAKDYEGFTFDSSIAGTNLSGNISGDGSLVLKLYYKRNSYNVTFVYTGDVPNDASSLPQEETYKYGAEINVPENATAEGYTFSGWIKDYITMPAQDIEITGYFIENPKSYNYKIEYYFDGELDESLEEILNAEKNEEISITPQTPLKHGERNYTLISNNHNITISINEEENVINVYYETDVLDYEIDNSEDTIEGDGIPDKYQIMITYKVENGSWDDGTKGTRIDVITLKDKDGNYAEDGTGELKVPQVGNKPSEGYAKGLWNKEFPSKVSKTNDGDEFIYSFKKKEIAKADISGTDGKLSNPKTSDIMPIFLLIGTTGITILMIAKNIRRKYSRKAKRIQY